MEEYKQRLQEAAEKNNVPNSIAQAFIDHALYGRGLAHGGFVKALMDNDFVNAVCRADSENGENLRGIALFMYNYLPEGSWGSMEKAKEWEGLARNQKEGKKENI